MGPRKLSAFISLSRKPVLMCVKLSGGKAASSQVFLASVGARHDKMWCKMVDSYQSYRWFRCCAQAEDFDIEAAVSLKSPSSTMAAPTG
jgi:hypothetical protein